MELRDVTENGVISIGGQLYQRRDHKGSVVNMELIYPTTDRTVIHRYPEATAVKPPSNELLRRFTESKARATAPSTSLSS